MTSMPTSTVSTHSDWATIAGKRVACRMPSAVMSDCAHSSFAPVSVEYGMNSSESKAGKAIPMKHPGAHTTS